MNEEHPKKIVAYSDTELSFDDFKKSLGVGAQKYSDEQIEKIRVIFDQMADVIFDSWLYNRKAHNVVEEIYDGENKNGKELCSPMQSELSQAN